MRIVFLGTPDFSVACLEMLYNSKHEIVGVVTQPDRKRNRGQVSFCPVKQRAMQLGLEVYQFEKIRLEGVETLKSLEPDLMITCAYGQIISQEILDIAHYGVFNVHASLLPKYRGSSPIQWAIINGEKQTGITIMQTALGVDSGDILLQRTVDILPKETAGHLFDRLALVGAETLLEALELLEKGQLKAVEQEHDKATHFPMLTKEMGNIDWSESAEKICRLVFGVNPWPSAYSKLEGKIFKIWDCEQVIDKSLLDKMARNNQGEGLIDNGNLYIKCGDGAIQIISLQLEGKRAMTSKEFLLGYNKDKKIVLSKD